MTTKNPSNQVFKVKRLKPNGAEGRRKLRRLSQVAGLILAVAVLGGCRQDMHDQPKLEPLEANSFFADGRSSRPVLEGTVARGLLKEDDHFYTGTVDGQPAVTFPITITREVLHRGQERYNIYCTPCHGTAGYGEGIIVSRGFRRPPSLHIDRLREESVGHYFDVMTNGLGAMYSYASRVDPADRWAIIAYIRALQLSQNAKPEDVPLEELERLRRDGQ
jgi:mono/diheme cytochrome c family protein